MQEIIETHESERRAGHQLHCPKKSFPFQNALYIGYDLTWYLCRCAKRMNAWGCGVLSEILRFLFCFLLSKLVLTWILRIKGVRLLLLNWFGSQHSSTCLFLYLFLFPLQLFLKWISQCAWLPVLSSYVGAFVYRPEATICFHTIVRAHLGGGGCVLRMVINKRGWAARAWA